MFLMRWLESHPFNVGFIEGERGGVDITGTSGMSLCVRPVSISRDVDVNYNSVRVDWGEGGGREGCGRCCFVYLETIIKLLIICPGHSWQSALEDSVKCRRARSRILAVESGEWSISLIVESSYIMGIITINICLPTLHLPLPCLPISQELQTDCELKKKLK